MVAGGVRRRRRGQPRKDGPQEPRGWELLTLNELQMATARHWRRVPEWDLRGREDSSCCCRRFPSCGRARGQPQAAQRKTCETYSIGTRGTSHERELELTNGTRHMTNTFVSTSKSCESSKGSSSERASTQVSPGRGH